MDSVLAMHLDKEYFIKEPLALEVGQKIKEKTALGFNPGKSSKDGNEKERTGAYILPSEELIGAWCKVYRKDRKLTNKYYALYEENVKYTKDGDPNTNWATKPVFMITKEILLRATQR